MWPAIKLLPALTVKSPAPSIPLTVRVPAPVRVSELLLFQPLAEGMATVTFCVASSGKVNGIGDGRQRREQNDRLRSGGKLKLDRVRRAGRVIGVQDGLPQRTGAAIGGIGHRQLRHDRGDRLGYGREGLPITHIVGRHAIEAIAVAPLTR